MVDQPRPSPSVSICSLAMESAVGVFALTLVATLVMRYSGLFVSVIDWDESLYALMADQWLSGGLPYDAVWDQHSVGLPALFALVLALFSKSILALRLSACIAVAVAATSLVFAIRMIDRRWVVSLVVALLYIGWTSRLWGLAANTEIYINALIAPAMLLLMRELRGEDRRGHLVRVGIAALLFGVALQIKHVAVAETALFLSALMFVSVRRGDALRTGALAIGCVALPTVLVLLYFFANGLGGEYVRAVIGANLTYAANRPSFGEILPDFPRSLFLLVAIAGAGIAVAMFRPGPLRLLLAAWAIAAGIDVTLPGQFWPHYFLLMAAPAALLAGVVMVQTRAHSTRWGAAVAVALAVLLTNPVGIAKDALKIHALGVMDAPRAVAERIGTQLGPEDSIFVLNYQPIVYFLSDAKLPTRHVFPADWSRRFLAVSGLDPQRELETIFAKRPKYVVFVEPDWLRMGDELFAALRNHLAGYTKEFEIVDRQLLPQAVPVQVYRRKDAIPEG